MNRRLAIPLISLLLCALALPSAAANRLPAAEKLVLRNGITVHYLKSAELPIVSLRLWIPGGGLANEPAPLEGVAGLAAELLMKGTATMSAEAVAEAVDFLGARLDVAAGDEFAGLSAESLAEHFPRLMAIAADCLMHPSFKAEEFDKERKTRLDGLRSVKDNPGAAVRSYFTKAYFGSHPLGHLSNGTEASLQAMTLANVQGYHKKYYRPEKSIAAVVGSLDKAAVLDLLNATIGQWKSEGAAAPASSIPPLPRPKGRKLILIDKPDATQAYWILGAPGYPLGDPATPSASVMNTLFGGRFTSWLNTELRIKRGLTYGAGSNFQTWRTGGLFMANSYTKNDKIGEMLDLVFDLFKKARGGFAPEEIESGRNYLLGQFPPTLETIGAKAQACVRLAFYGLGFDYYDKYLAGIQGVTGELAKGAAGKLLPADDFVLVVVGKSAEIKAQLAKYGTWVERKISDPGF